MRQQTVAIKRNYEIFKMSKKIKIILYGIIAIAVILLILTATGMKITKESSVEVNQPANIVQRTIIIPGDTQGTYGDLRIGVGGVRRDNYTLGTGEKRIGRVADLWLFYRPDSSKNTKITVYIGERVRIGKYSFVVYDIRGGKGSVELKFDSDP